jgi:hypothetical protein
MKGFSQKWYRWIEQIVSEGSVGVKVNDELDHIFQTKKGLRQGDPLSLVLFNVMVNILRSSSRDPKAKTLSGA